MGPMRLMFATLAAIVLLQCGVNCFINLPFLNLNLGGSSIFSQDRLVTQRISKLIANSRIAATNTRSQANSINREIETVSGRFFFILSENVTETTLQIFRPSEELLERALNISEAIADCVSEQSDEIAIAINNTIALLTQCKINKIQEGLNLVNNILTNSASTLNISQNAIQGLGNCIRLANQTILGFLSPRVLACKLNLAANVTQQYAIVGANAVRLIAQAKLYLLNLKISLASCGILATAQAATSAATIAAEIAACFANSTISG